MRDLDLFYTLINYILLREEFVPPVNNSLLHISNMYIFGDIKKAFLNEEIRRAASVFVSAVKSAANRVQTSEYVTSAYCQE